MLVEITVRGKHLEIPETVEERVRLKFGRLEHYLPALQDATVEVHLAHEKAKDPDLRYLVHVSVSGHGVHLQAEERAAQMEQAIDRAAKVLRTQARRHKQRMYGRGRSGKPSVRIPARTRAAKRRAPEDAEAVEFDGVARVKRFPVKPMTTEEALEQMELSGHNFYIFQDADIDQFALLYRRKAGDIGLIIPELA